MWAVIEEHKIKDKETEKSIKDIEWISPWACIQLYKDCKMCSLTT